MHLEHAGIKLWNLTGIAIKVESNQEAGYLLCRCKIFASMLLSVCEAMHPSDERKLVTFKCYLISFKITVDRNWNKLKEDLQEHLERNLAVLDNAVDSSTDTNYDVSVKRLKFEYFVTNFQCSVKEGDLEAATIFSSKADIRKNYMNLDPSTVLELCRIIYNAATLLKDSPNINCRNSVISLLNDVQYYLELPIINLKSHSEFNNLKYTSLLLLTSCLIGKDIRGWDPRNCESNLRMLHELYPSKVEPFVLEIQFRNIKDKQDSSNTIEDVLMRMVMSVDIAAHFDTVISSINDFALKNPKEAANVLDYIYLNKLNPENEQIYLEKLAVLRFLMITQAKTMTNAEIVESLEYFSTFMEQGLIREISKHTISSIITLLWNSGKKLEKSGNCKEGIKFYKLALNDVLSRKYKDKAKLQRALQNAYIVTESYTEAEKVYELMDPPDKKSPLTQLLLLRSCLHTQNEDAALICLSKIRNSKQENAQEVLILAATECKKSTQLAIKVMSLLLEVTEGQDNVKELSNWIFPTMCLLRNTLQMFLKMAEDKQEHALSHNAATIKNLLKNGVNFLTRCKALGSLGRRSEKQPMIQVSIYEHEIEWLASTSYNLALQCTNHGLESHQLDFGSFSLQYVEMIPLDDLTALKKAHYASWKFRVIILCILSKKNFAALGDDVSLRDLHDECSCLLNDISLARNDQLLLSGCAPAQLDFLNECYMDALTLAYEIALDLGDRAKVAEVLKATADSSNPQTEALLIDTATANAGLPHNMLLEIIETIVERNIGNMNIGIYLLCSWLRILMDSSSSTDNDSKKSLSERVLARVRTTNRETQANVGLFKQEMEMLATLAWNEGVRSIIEGHNRIGKDWCKISIEFASFVNDALETHLKALWKSLDASANMDNRMHDHSYGT